MSGDIEMESLNREYIDEISRLNNRIVDLESTLELQGIHMKICSNCGLKWEDKKGDIPCPRCHVSPDKPPMTLERAVEILNERKHYNEELIIYTQLMAVENKSFAADRFGDNSLSEFEAIAIAEKYESERK
jgi:uncharacterized Zn finger protein (UPF0148 family)